MRPDPVLLEPILVPKPWGGVGRELRRVLAKRLPDDARVGESWEFVDMPSAESRVRAGPFCGQTLQQLLERFGDDFFPRGALQAGRLPLLFKFLEACESLSLQVHPHPGREAEAAKHEAWLTLAAAPDAVIYAGFKPGVGEAEAQRAAGSSRFVDLLNVWPARAGDVFHLPSGAPHALGAGVLVAEAQTSSDITYRLYDWGRTLPGRGLSIAEGLRSARYDVSPATIRPAPRLRRVPGGEATQLVECAAFDWLRIESSAAQMQGFGPAIWACLEGGGRLPGASRVEFGQGDVFYWPAASAAGELLLNCHARFLCLIPKSPHVHVLAAD